MAFRKTFEAMGITYEPSYYEVYYWIGDVLWTQQQRQQITVQEIHDTIFHRLLAALAIDADADAFGKFFHQQLHEEAILEPEAAEALSYLSERYKLYVASNGMLDMQRSRLQVEHTIGGYIELIALTEIAECFSGFWLQDSFFVELLMEELPEGIGISVDGECG